MEIITKSQDMVLTVNGYRVPMAEKVIFRSKRAVNPMEGYGSVQPRGRDFGRVSHEIELHRIHMTTQEGFDILDFFEMEDFAVVLKRDGRTVTFSDCNWVEVEESLSGEDRLLQKAVLVARERSVAL